MVEGAANFIKDLKNWEKKILRNIGGFQKKKTDRKFCTKKACPLLLLDDSKSKSDVQTSRKDFSKKQRK